MIIFDLSSLSDDSHRRHFIDSSCVGTKEHYERWLKPFVDSGTCPEWSPDYAAYYAASHKDKEIQSTVSLFHDMHRCENKVQIWTHQSESNRENISYWLVDKMRTDYCTRFCTSRDLKMRPIGDESPTEQLFEGWLDHIGDANEMVDMAFSADPDVIALFRRKGVFTFDCRQDVL